MFIYPSQRNQGIRKGVELASKSWRDELRDMVGGTVCLFGGYPLTLWRNVWSKSIQFDLTGARYR